MAENPQTKPIDFGCESATCENIIIIIIIQDFYSAYRVRGYRGAVGKDVGKEALTSPILTLLLLLLLLKLAVVDQVRCSLTAKRLVDESAWSACSRRWMKDRSN